MGDGCCCHYCGRYVCECPEEPMPPPDLLELRKEAVAWQRATFPDVGAQGAADHLLKEATELQIAVGMDAPREAIAEELADVWLLVMSTADRAGIDLEAAVAAKLEKNRARTWKRHETHYRHEDDAEKIGGR